MKSARWGWRLLAVAWLGLLATAVAAGECTEPERGQFDFWIGAWEVRTLEGRLAGTSRIQRDLGGCVVRERHEGIEGYRGESLSVYDAAQRVWHQTWFDNRGRVLAMDGGLREGSMVLEGRGAAADGPAERQRISWTPRPDGTVTQLWESTAGGDQWTVVFYGTYRRK